MSQIAKNLHKALKEMGHEMPLGHVYEALAKTSGYRSWNAAKRVETSLSRVENYLDKIRDEKFSDVLNKLVSDFTVEDFDSLVLMEEEADLLMDAIQESFVFSIPNFIGDIELTSYKDAVEFGQMSKGNYREFETGCDTLLIANSNLTVREFITSRVDLELIEMEEAEVPSDHIIWDKDSDIKSFVSYGARNANKSKLHYKMGDGSIIFWF